MRHSVSHLLDGDVEFTYKLTDRIAMLGELSLVTTNIVIYTINNIQQPCKKMLIISEGITFTVSVPQGNRVFNVNSEPMLT